MYQLSVLRKKIVPNAKGGLRRMADEVRTDKVAEYLKISIEEASRLIKRGRIKGEKRGRDYWAEMDSVVEYAKTRRPSGRPLDTLSSEPAQSARYGTGDAAERERAYQREYKRRKRAEEAKKAAAAAAAAKESSAKAAATPKKKTAKKIAGKKK